MCECRRLLPIGCWLVLALGVAACSGDDAPEPTTGSLSLELTIVDGIDIDVVHWEITGGQMEPMSGTIDTSAPGSTASVEVFGLPPGEGYMIRMEAAFTGGPSGCEGSAEFGIAAGEVTELGVMLKCKRPERFGGVRVNGKPNSCAELTKVVVSPLETSVGSDIDLAALASDAEGHAIGYEWTATGGSIDEPTSPMSVYTCTGSGPHSIRIAVSDTEPCVDDWTVQVSCTDGGGGTGGGSGSGGAGGSGGSGARFSCDEGGIRAAIAAGGGPHTFDCDGPTIIVTGSEIEIDTDVNLDGGGDLEVNGNDEHRVFAITPNVTAELRGLRITGGTTTSEGAGVLNRGDLTLVDTTVSRNAAHHDYELLLSGAGTGNGGGVANHGTLTLIDSTISENSASHGEEIRFDGRATGDGGGIHNRGTLTLIDSVVTNNTASHGGGLFTTGSAALTDCTISDNTSFIVSFAATEGGGVFVNPGGVIELTRCAVHDNLAMHGSGGGLHVQGRAVLNESVLSSNDGDLGGGLFSKGGFVTIRKSTVSGHDVRQGAGLENFGGIMIVDATTVSGNTASGAGGGILSHGDLQDQPAGTLILVNSTVSGNAAGNSGGGLFNHRSQLILISSTVARNQGGRDILNSDPSSRAVNSIIEGTCRGQEPLISEGGNVESPGNTCGFAEETDRVVVTPEQLALGPLTDNGGPTRTHALEVGSVAIDRVSIESCLDHSLMPLLVDQRGVERPQGSACDSGAVEVEPLD